jgi:hypothetical protein
MTGLRQVLTVGTVLLSPLLDQAWARSGVATERPWAPEHIEGLPLDIRKDVEGHAKACGNPPAAGHYFSLSIEGAGLRFRAQHFDDFACERRPAVCRPDGCLHEVFVDDGRRQRHVFSVYARDIKLTNEGGVAGIEVFDDAGVRQLVWNGSRFVAKRKLRKER